MIHEDYQKLWEGLKDDYIRYETLPMAVYISAKDGHFVRANEKAISLLGLNRHSIETENIIGYYINPRDREGVIKRLKNRGHNNWLESETLRFKIPDGRSVVKKSLRYFAKPFFLDPKDPETWIGSISLVFEISEIERFRDLEQLMPVGVFEVSGEKMEVTYRNRKFDDYLWIDPAYTKSIRARDLFIDETELEDLYKKLMKGESIQNEIVRLRRISNHSNILAKLNIVPENYENKAGELKLLRSKGFIEDITFSSFLDAPIGLYVVMRDADNKEVLTWANNEFAKINGFSSSEECMGKHILGMYEEAEEHIYADFLNAFEKAAKQKKYLINYRLEFINTKGEQRQLYVHAKAIYSKDGRIIGRVGAIIDFTANVKEQLQKEVDTDYAAFLHLYKGFIHDIQTTLFSIIRGHNSNILTTDSKVDLDISAAFATIIRSAKRLDGLLTVFLSEAVEKELIQEPFKAGLLDIIRKLRVKFGEEKTYSSLMAKTQASDIRASLIEVRKRLNNNERLKNLMPSRPWKEIQQEIAEILRYARLISLWQITIQAEGMFADLDILNRAINPLGDKDEGSETFSAEDILDEVKNDIAQYAKNERVKIDLRYEIDNSDKLIVYGIKRNLYAAIYNILNNAIKYTWKKPSMIEAYVRVRVSGTERIENNKLKRYLVIAVENRGDAILKKELKTKIFQFGYRGAIAVNSRKKGTGVGLWHTKKIVDEFAGNITVTSDPIAERNALPVKNEFDRPFITIVTIELPIN